MKATRIVSRKEIMGKNNGPAWLYTLDNGVECTTSGLAKASGLDLAPQSFVNRMEKHGFTSPKVFQAKQLGQSKRGKAKGVSCAEAKLLLNKFNKEHKIKVETTFIEIEGYEPVLVDEVAYSIVTI